MVCDAADFVSTTPPVSLILPRSGKAVSLLPLLPASTPCQLMVLQLSSPNLLLLFFQARSVRSPPFTLHRCPFLAVTIAAVPSIRPLCPVGGLPPSPSRSLGPWLLRTAGRRCAAPLPLSPTGRGNESPRRLGPACMRVGVSLMCTCGGRANSVVFDVVFFFHLCVHCEAWGIIGLWCYSQRSFLGCSVVLLEAVPPFLLPLQMSHSRPIGNTPSMKRAFI